MIITIGNDGQAIASTNYWQSEHASAGFFYLSGNAGALRLLVPKAAEGNLSEMFTGRSVTIEKSIVNPKICLDIVFEDGTESPFSVSLDKKQIDSALENGRTMPFTVWTEHGCVMTTVAAIKL